MDKAQMISPSALVDKHRQAAIALANGKEILVERAWPF